MAINPDSTIKWQTNMCAGDALGVAIGVDGTVYLAGVNGSGNADFYALCPTNGTTIWHYPGTHDWVWNAPALGPDGTVYFGDYSQVFAITNGSLKWAYPTNFTGLDTFKYSSPVVGPDGTIYVNALNYNRIYALNPDGSLKWSLSGLNTGELSSFAVSSDGIIYCLGATSTNNCYLVALNTNGTVKWQLAPPTNTFFYCTPEIGPDGTIYIEAVPNPSYTYYYTNTLFALTPNGTIKWIFPLFESGGTFYHGSTCAIASDGEIYATTTAGTIYSLAPNGTMNWSYQTPINGLTAPIIGPDGTVYVTSYTYNILYAFYGPAPVACGQWPQYRNNSRNTAAFAPAHLSSPNMQTDGFQFTISGISNMPVCPCASSDLANWTNLGQVVLTNGTANFMDIGTSNYQYRFYRVWPQ